MGDICNNGSESIGDKFMIAKLHVKMHQLRGISKLKNTVKKSHCKSVYVSKLFVFLYYAVLISQNKIEELQ